MVKRVKNWKVDAVIGGDEPEREYMVVGHNHWGRGTSIAAARTKWRLQSGRIPSRKDVRVYDVPRGAWVDDYGFGISWPKQDK